MRIAYLAHWDAGESSGVYRKIESQIKSWTYLGEKVLFVHVGRSRLRPPGGFEGDWESYQYERSWSSRTRAWHRAARAVLAWHPDIVYYRYDLYWPVLSDLATRTPMVVEVNTDDMREYCMGNDRRCLYNLATRGLLFRRVAGNVFVSHELASMPHFSCYRRPYVVIGNSIKLADFPWFGAPKEPGIRLVFLGTAGQSWHGVDKICRLAAMRPDWMFDLIGPDAASSHEARLTNVRFHGPLTPQQYRPILEKADVGIGTLAIHRKGMNEASPLKIREYLACGLPVLIGYRDTDFPPPEPEFICRIPNTEDNIESSIQQIDAFVSRCKSIRVQRKSVAHLDCINKERKRLDFFWFLLRDWRGSGTS